jgi:hypothetical protein
VSIYACSVVNCADSIFLSGDLVGFTLFILLPRPASSGFHSRLGKIVAPDPQDTSGTSAMDVRVFSSQLSHSCHTRLSWASGFAAPDATEIWIVSSPVHIARWRWRTRCTKWNRKFRTRAIMSRCHGNVAPFSLCGSS